MAAVTQNKKRRAVEGDTLVLQFNIDLAATGDTLVVPMRTVEQVIIEQSNITGYSVAAGSVYGTSTITFTASGAASGVDVNVRGRD